MTGAFRPLPRSDDGSLPEADRFDDLPHPREMLDLVGHAEAEQALLDAYRSGRMHHAWILGGLEGIGKAVLAYRFARFVLAHPDPSAPAVAQARTLEVDAGHRMAQLVAAQGHPDLAIARREPRKKGDGLASEISVERVRAVIALFQSTPSFGGWRIAIVDALEDLNRSGANALLKMLEEPPPRSLFLIVSHQPGRVLPTIRSRCRMLQLRPLAAPEIERIVAGLSGGHDEAERHEAALAAGGSARRAFRLLDPESRAFRSKLGALLEALPVLDGQAALDIAEATTKRDDIAFGHFVETTEAFLSAAVAARLKNGGETVVRFADAYEAFTAGWREVETYNLDRRPLVLATLADLAEAVRHD